MDCKDCVFRKNEVFPLLNMEAQVGCEAGRLDVLKSLGKAERCTGIVDEDITVSYYVLDRFCNMYRDENWGGTDEIYTMSMALNKATYETKPLFGVVVAGDVSSTLETFEATVKSLLNNHYPREKLRIILSIIGTEGADLPALADLINRTQKSEKVDIRAVFHHLLDTSIKDYDSFSKIAQATYFVKVTAGTEVPRNLFDMVDKSLNKDLEHIFLFETEGVSIVRAVVMTALYPQFNDYDLAINEIRDISQHAGKYSSSTQMAHEEK